MELKLNFLLAVMVTRRFVSRAGAAEHAERTNVSSIALEGKWILHLGEARLPAAWRDATLY